MNKKGFLKGPGEHLEAWKNKRGKKFESKSPQHDEARMPVQGVTVGDGQQTQHYPHTHAEDQGGGSLLRHEDDGEDPLIGVVSVARRNEATSGVNDAATSPGNAQPADTSLHAEPSVSHNYSKTPIWSGALEEWSKKSPEVYQALGDEASGALDNPSNVIGVLSGILWELCELKSRDTVRAKLRKYLSRWAMKTVVM
ncbi:hypothetical protein PSPO01_08215 [Paraphaeosphaeria sporulosa]